MILPGLPKRASPIQFIKDEGDELAARIGALHAVKNSEAFKGLAALDAHLLTLQAEVMQSYLHILTIRLARASDAEKGIVPDTATALPGGKPGIIKPNGH